MASNYGERVLLTWNLLSHAVKGKVTISLNGNTLQIHDIANVAKYGGQLRVGHPSSEIVARTNSSVAFLHAELQKGHSIYGVTTGFGGSADTSTTNPERLQVALLQMQLSAVLPAYPDDSRPSHLKRLCQAELSDCHEMATLSMPESWVRATMLIRCNSLLRGHSGVRFSVIQSLLALLRNNVVPLVPVRGSISASGDLCPLAYLAGALAGNPDIRCWVGSPRTLVTADEALRRFHLNPVSFWPKETLGILNGTAVSAAVATLAQFQADHFMILAQVTTAMGVEALLGRQESFDSFFADVRPHKGQKTVAKTITMFLKGCELARESHDDRGSHVSGDGKLRQDRYALRTASQWLGPYVEDLVLARQQLETELNSTTDNPIFDVVEGKVHHGGNFQAVSVTSATEKTRLALQMIGKMIFAQCSELLDSHQNNGLPSNLSADEPSLSFTMKGVDINMAAYMSELAHLANPLSSHVQSAEMHNQAINSLALVSARYTHMALDVLSLMFATYLYTLCQALDLRAMNYHFMESVKSQIEQYNEEILKDHVHLPSLNQAVWTGFEDAFETTTSRDSTDRFSFIAKSLQPIILEALGKSSSWDILQELPSWTKGLAQLTQLAFNAHRSHYMEVSDASPYLGAASKRIYQFIRKVLNVPFHRGLVDHPTHNHNVGGGRELKNTGSQISIIYDALRNETLIGPVMECLHDALQSYDLITLD